MLAPAGTAALATVAGIAIANGYAIQPALGDIAISFGAPITVVGYVTSGALVGYLVGLLVLMPLVDRIRPAYLIPTQLLALATALCAAAATRSASALIAAFLVVGALTTVAGQSSAVVGKFAAPRRQGTQMGVVAAGVSLGILLSRFVGGTLSATFGWRAMLLICAATCVVAAAVAASVLPREIRPSPSPSRSIVRSIPGLLIRHRSLRWASVSGALWFFAFNVVWVGMALALSREPYSLSASSIGLYGLAGALGLATNWPAGKLTDRWGSRRVMVPSLLVAALAAISLTAALDHPAWIAVSLALFDAGCFSAQVANQTVIVTIDNDRAGSFVSIYMLIYYSAGAFGTVAASILVGVGGWPLASTIAAAAVATAGVVAYFSPQKSPHRVRTDPNLLSHPTA